MFQDIEVEQLLAMKHNQDVTLIDVRSPGEYAEFTIPHSINIPLFDDEERKEIGILYKHVSIKAAQERGLEIVSAKLPAFIKRFEQISERKVVFCWRGGMRSKTTATVLSLMSIRVFRLTGGIRAYRNWVHYTLEQHPVVPPFIVISGHTGTGKTQILRKLLSKSYPVLDLEQLAQHRGSIFGHINLQPNNQKTFEALLLEQLIAYRDRPYLLLEAESSRIGKVTIPEFLMKHKEQGLVFQIHMPIERRVQTIIDDYQPHLYHAACFEAFEYIRKRIHTPIAVQIQQYLSAHQYREAVELLLQHYYDPRYHHAGIQYTNQPIHLHVQDAEDAVDQIEDKLKKLYLQLGHQ